MGNIIKQHRIQAVQRFRNGESPESICTSFGKSRVWLYKWIKRYSGEEPSWCEDRSRRPLSTPLQTPAEVEEIVKMIRLNLYNQELFCGAQAIYWEMDELGVKPLPSISCSVTNLSSNCFGGAILAPLGDGEFCPSSCDNDIARQQRINTSFSLRLLTSALCP